MFFAIHVIAADANTNLEAYKYAAGNFRSIKPIETLK